MSRRARARREAMESKYIAMHSDDTDDMDWEDADYDSLAVYREADAQQFGGKCLLAASVIESLHYVRI